MKTMCFCPTKDEKKFLFQEIAFLKEIEVSRFNMEIVHQQFVNFKLSPSSVSCQRHNCYVAQIWKL